MTQSTTDEARSRTVPDGEPAIRLDALTKTFRGQPQPAVDALDLEIAEGEVCVLVGPSGCGKTTTMRLVNRLIEPTSGRIVLAGEDVTQMNPDVLRRRIGYVIQQVGLFPHLTVEDNVAAVPQVLGWDRGHTRQRVEELLELVGLEASQYRGRYPKELSGGQAQRVGVARAMAADPPFLLMDEPFGAIDPVTRDRLQNEFLALQHRLRKTIIFVTHDINEAIKMGNRVAVLSNGAHVEQYDTPAALLSAPANDFVSDFVGSGASLRGLNLLRVGDVPASEAWPVVAADTSIETARAALHNADAAYLLTIDQTGRPRQWVSERELDHAIQLDASGRPVAAVEENATLHDALDQMLTDSVGAAAIVDGRGSLVGIVDIDSVMEAIARMREQSRVASRSADRPRAGNR